MRIAVIGAGAMGSIYGGHLSHMFHRRPHFRSIMKLFW